MSSPDCICAAPTDVSRVMYGQNEVRLCCPTLCALWYYTQLSLSPRTQLPSHLSHQELCPYTAAQEKAWNTGLSSRVQWGLTCGAALWKRGVIFCRKKKKKKERSMKSQRGAFSRERSSIARSPTVLQSVVSSARPSSQGVFPAQQLPRVPRRKSLNIVVNTF